MSIITRRESAVRSYCRDFPATFATAQGATLKDEDGTSYLDFFAGAGALNYGHNPPELRDALIAYLQGGGVAHTLDLTTEAKCAFLESFETHILTPRGLDYKVMFPGPTGTNAVEAAIKLARKVTGRTNIIAFSNGFHGMTLGSLALTGNRGKRAGAGVPLGHVTRVPFDNDEGLSSLDLLEHYLSNPSSGVDTPAAVILETVQAEGGVRVARWDWLRRLRRLTQRHDVLLIVDDIQVGCGRTGPFFSFEPAGIEPDIVCLSKALSGFGLPFALTLFTPGLDQWSPGEHNGTFRGNNLAFVTAKVALDTYWADSALSQQVAEKAALVTTRLEAMAPLVGAARRGRGLIQGLTFEDADRAQAVSRAAYRRGLIIETAGARGEVLKLLPPLTIPRAELERGLDIIEDCLDLSTATLGTATESGLRLGAEGAA